MTSPREMSITYGSLVAPGNFASVIVHLVSIHRIFRGPESVEVSYRIVIEAPDPATLATACILIEEEVTTQRQDLTVRLLGQSSVSLSEADSTGFDIIGEISKPGEEDPRYDTNRSRLYDVVVRAGVPALTPDGDFLRDFEYDITYTPSRKGGIFVSGVYTADPGPPQRPASEVYLAEIDARVAAIALDLGWTVEIVSEDYTSDQEDQLAAFQRSYRQVFFSQSGSTLNDPRIVDPALVVRVIDEGTDGDPAAVPFKTLVGEYSAAIDIEVLATENKDMIDIFDDVILPWIVKNMERVGGGPLLLDKVEPVYNWDESTIQVTVNGRALPGGSLISRTVEFTDAVDYGKLIRYVWPEATEIQSDDEADDATGLARPTPAYVYQANRLITRTAITREERLGLIPEGGGNAEVKNVGSPRVVLSEGAGASVIGEFGRPAFTGDIVAVKKTKRVRTIPSVKGIAGSQQATTVKETTEVWELIVAVGGDGDGEGGAGAGAAGVGGAPTDNKSGPGGR